MKRRITILSISFIFSVFIWLYINLSHDYVIDLSVPLNVKLSGRQALGNELPSSIDLTVKGKGWDLISLKLSKSAVYNLDLTNYKRDTRISTIQEVRNLLNIPASISVVNIHPDTLEIMFDNLTEKMVKVRNGINVIPKEGYLIIGHPQITPDSIKITGASSVLSKIKFLSTENITLSDINANITKTVKIKDTLQNIIKIEPKQVSVTFYIELAAEKEFDGISLLINGIPEDKEVIVIPPKIKLTFRGGVEQLSNITSENVRAKIDFKSIEKDSTGYITPNIELPENINLIKYEPEQFQYIIKKRN
jgi:YbbR domain-containing protein